MTHDYHEGLPGYSPAQILHDGCGLCEARAKGRDGGISHLDSPRFALAWERADQWNQSGLPDLSHAEMPLLSKLWAVRLQLERAGIPISAIPTGGAA